MYVVVGWVGGTEGVAFVCHSFSRVGEVRNEVRDVAFGGVVPRTWVSRSGLGLGFVKSWRSGYDVGLVTWRPRFESSTRQNFIFVKFGIVC